MEQNKKIGSLRNDFIMFQQDMKAGNLCTAIQFLSKQYTFDVKKSKSDIQINKYFSIVEKVSRNGRLYSCCLLMNERDENKTNHFLELQIEINRLLNVKNQGFNDHGIN